MDEMQEQKMLRIEHNGCWIAFWGLFIMILAQVIYYGPEQAKDRIAGEVIVGQCMGTYMVVACIKNAVWDRRFEPSVKVNLIASLIAGVLSGMVNFMIVCRQGFTVQASISSAISVAIFRASLCMILLSLASAIFRWRRGTLEKEEAEVKDR